MENTGRCNNCWSVSEVSESGACPSCGCYVFMPSNRRTKFKHGAMWLCKSRECPRMKPPEE